MLLTCDYYGIPHVWGMWKMIKGVSTGSNELTTSTLQTVDFTASAGVKYIVDSASGVVTITPPASPSTGDKFKVVDVTGEAANNVIVIDFVTAGQNLHSVSQTHTINFAESNIEFEYIDVSIGWVKL